MSKPSKELKLASVVFLSTTILLSMLAQMVATPTPKKQSFQIYILGATRKTDYYHGDESSVLLERKAKWHLGISNTMSSLQYVVVRIRFANATFKTPDDASQIPSPAPILVEFGRVLASNETWETFFIWRIKEINVNADVINPILLEVNGVEIRNSSVSRVSTLRGRNFRIIFELWTFDQETNSLVFGWREGGERKTAWLQMWFNLTTQARTS
ncbi:MAG: hypothetical protein V1857_02555 [archaeon]